MQVINCSSSFCRQLIYYSTSDGIKLKHLSAI